jgi:uncharacterized membrane protein YgcG
VPGDWREPTYDERRLGDTSRASWVRLTTNGNLVGQVATYGEDGRVVPAANLRMAFLQSGRKIAQVNTDNNGMFLTTLTPGVYSVIATGDAGFLAFAVTVLPAQRVSRPAGAAEGEAPSESQVEPSLEVVAYSPPFETLKSVIERYYPEMTVPIVDEASFGQVQQPDPMAQVQTFGIRDWLSAEGMVRDLVDRLQPVTNIRAHKVLLGPDGTLRGRLLGIDPVTGRPVRIRQMNVFLVRGNEVIARGAVDADGVVDLSNVQPGHYSFVAAGRDGLAALGVELVTMGQANQATLPNYVAFQGPPQPLLVTVVTDPRDVQSGTSGETEGGGGGGAQQPPPQQGTGGGGGGGGGGGAGDLLPLAAVGAAIAAGALSTQDEVGSPPGP